MSPLLFLLTGILLLSAAQNIVGWMINRKHRILMNRYSATITSQEKIIKMKDEYTALLVKQRDDTVNLCNDQIARHNQLMDEAITIMSNFKEEVLPFPGLSFSRSFALRSIGYEFNTEIDMFIHKGWDGPDAIVNPKEMIQLSDKEFHQFITNLSYEQTNTGTGKNNY